MSDYGWHWTVIKLIGFWWYFLSLLVEGFFLLVPSLTYRIPFSLHSYRLIGTTIFQTMLFVPLCFLLLLVLLWVLSYWRKVPEIICSKMEKDCCQGTNGSWDLFCGVGWQFHFDLKRRGADERGKRKTRRVGPGSHIKLECEQPSTTKTISVWFNLISLISFVHWCWMSCWWFGAAAMPAIALSKPD